MYSLFVVDDMSVRYLTERQLLNSIGIRESKGCRAEKEEKEIGKLGGESFRTGNDFPYENKAAL